jgi:di/tricarboxylate transporter
MTEIAMTSDMILVFVVIAFVILLFLFEWIRVDVVAILTMVSLPVLGLVSSQEAFSGFSSNAVLSIIAVIIMGRGLDRTGVINRSVRPLIRFATAHRYNIISLLSLTMALISSVMQNIGAAALFLPALRRVSRQSGLALSQLLMPAGFAAILGGTITLVGSSPLIMLNDLLEPFGLPTFGLFSVTPVGITLVLAGIGYFILLGRWILPRRNAELEMDESDSAEIEKYYDKLGQLFEVHYHDTDGESPCIWQLCDEFFIHTVIYYETGSRQKLFPPPREAAICPGSIFAVYGSSENVQAAAEKYGFEIHPELSHFVDDLSTDFSGIVEGVVSPHSKFIGKSLGEIHFRHNYLVSPMALYRRHEAYYSQLAAQVLEPGDALLMHGRWDHFQRFRRTRDLIFTHSMDHELLHPKKSLLAIGFFLLATALALFSSLPLPVCLMAGAIGMIISGVIKIDEAYHGVDWRTIFLLAGLIPLGIATQKTGAAAWLAQNILALVGTPSEYIFLLIVASITTLFTLVISNVGAAVLLVPLVVNMAQSTGVDPGIAALAVGIAASNSFMLPTHQVNALYMGPGHYKSGDFLRTGAPLSLIFIFVLTTLLYFFY